MNASHIRETRAALNLRFIVPAVKREDLRLRIEGRMLRLSGERRPPLGFVHRMHAYLHEGVLDVHIPFAGNR